MTNDASKPIVDDAALQERLQLAVNDAAERYNGIYMPALLDLLEECRAAELTDEQSLPLRAELAEQMRGWLDAELKRVTCEVMRDGSTLQ